MTLIFYSKKSLFMNVGKYFLLAFSINSNADTAGKIFQNTTKSRVPILLTVVLTIIFFPILYKWDCDLFRNYAIFRNYYHHRNIKEGVGSDEFCLKNFKFSSRSMTCDDVHMGISMANVWRVMTTVKGLIKLKFLINSFWPSHH